MNEPHLPRRDQLLVDGALGLLDGSDATAFDALLRDPGAAAEFAALERAAALVALADSAAEIARTPTSRSLDARLRDDAVRFFAKRTPEPRPTAIGDGSRWPTPLRVAPWLLTAAAGLLLLVGGGEPEPLAPDVARAAMVVDATGLVRCEWTPGPSPLRGDVRGDVVWDPRRQHGYVRLSGLPQLDDGHRYQLWIVDGTRQGPPVDGGLLEPRGAVTEGVVPIVAKLPVRQPVAFVLTVETADGVVVSAQEHVVAIAKP